MKRIAMLLGAALTVCASVASAQDYKACQTTYKSTVEACAKSLAGYEPALRVGFQKACVKDAQLKRDLCMNGGLVDQCLATCQQLYEGEAQVCEATYQAALSQCANVFFCEAVVTQERDDCLAPSIQRLNTCTQGCLAQ